MGEEEDNDLFEPAELEEQVVDEPPKVATPAPAPEKLILKDAHKLRDPNAKTEVYAIRTVSAFAANQEIVLVAGRKQRVPSAAVPDLVRTGCILRPPRFEE